MKKLIILPGNSIRNREWLYDAGDYYAGKQWFSEIYLHEYLHWQTGEEQIDMEGELLRLEAAISADSPHEYVLFGKSVGSLLGLLAVDKGIFKPTHSVFFGMPLDMAKEQVFKDDWSALRNFSVPSLAFHNDADPVANHDAAKQLLKQHASTIEFITTPGDDHRYADFEGYDATIGRLLGE